MVIGHVDFPLKEFEYTSTHLNMAESDIQAMLGEPN